MILRWLEVYFLLLCCSSFTSSGTCPTSSIIYKKSDLPLPKLLGSSIYALVRPKVPPKTAEERIAREYQEDALERLIRCRLNNTRCFRLKPPQPKVEFGKFCWTSQKFEPLRAGISQLRCKAPKRPYDATTSTYWASLLNMSNKTLVEIDMSISNFFLAQLQIVLVDAPAITWADILGSPLKMIPMLLGQMNAASGGVNPLDPMFPLNPLFPYSPLNPFLNLDEDMRDSPLNPDGPFHPLNPASPFSSFNPGNPFNALSPMLLLPPSDPMSPWNPASPYFPLSPHSPYNPDFEKSPMNSGFNLEGPPPCSPFSPLNGNFLISKHSPWYPLGPLAQLSLLPDTDFYSPLNPQSPFNPIAALHPQNPLEGLAPDHFLSPLNLEAHPFNIINGEEIKRSVTETSPAYIPGPPPSSPKSNDAAPPMVPAEMYKQPARAIGRWYYQFKPAPQTIAVVNPCDPRSPLFAGDAYSPFHPLHPSNPYSILNPLNTLPITDPRSPYNPRSSNFAGNPESPYNPAHPMNPFNPDSFVFTCRQTGSLHPLNPRSPFYLLNPRSPYNPANPFSPYNPNHPLLSGLEEAHALNPAIRTSPFNPSKRGSPYNPDNYRKLNPQYALNPLNDLYKRITSPSDPEPHLGWYNGVKEDFSKIPPPPPPPGSEPKDQLIPYSAPKQQVNCPLAPAAPPPPQPPYFPGYYQWEPSWPAPRYVRTSNIPTNEPITVKQWQEIWERLWKLKCKRESFLAHPTSPLGNDFAIIDLPQTV
jgi:hypothetical protein